MLARIAHDIFWIARRLGRAEHTARMLDSLFQADLTGRRDDPAAISLSWQAAIVVMGTRHPGGAEYGPALRDEVVRRLTTDAENPASIVSCVAAARDGARTLRDTISIEMWEALNTFDLTLQERDLEYDLRTTPYSIYSYVRERAALFWGLALGTMQRDEAHAFLIAGERIEAADMVLRMLRVTLPPVRQADEESAERPRRDGNALGLLRAIGGFQAFMRSASSAPDADPVARFLLFDREFPHSVAASVDVLSRVLTRADPARGDSPPVLRLRRLLADLDLRSRESPTGEALPASFRDIQHELQRAEREIEAQYFAGHSADPARSIVA